MTTNFYSNNRMTFVSEELLHNNVKFTVFIALRKERFPCERMGMCVWSCASYI